jgi:hypothetical protein
MTPAIERGDLRAQATGSAIRKDYALLRPGERNEKARGSFDRIVSKTPPRTIIEADEYHSVILKALLLWMVIRGTA